MCSLQYGTIGLGGICSAALSTFSVANPFQNSGISTTFLSYLFYGPWSKCLVNGSLVYLVFYIVGLKWTRNVNRQTMEESSAAYTLYGVAYSFIHIVYYSKLCIFKQVKVRRRNIDNNCKLPRSMQNQFQWLLRNWKSSFLRSIMLLAF